MHPWVRIQLKDKFWWHTLQSVLSNLSAISLLISCECVSFMYTLRIIHNMISHVISTCKFFKYFKPHTPTRHLLFVIILVWNIDDAPVSLAIVIFSYNCHPALPGVEESLQNRSQFPKILALSYTFVTILKIVFSVCAFLSFSPDIPDVISCETSIHAKSWRVN